LPFSFLAFVDSSMVRALVATLSAVVAAKTVPLATFDGAKETTLPFVPVNDPVMGGQSKSTFTTDGNKGIFEGEVKVVPSLQAPGFCNLEAPGFRQTAVTFPDISGTDGIVLDVNQTLPNGLTNWDVSIQTETSKKATSTGGGSWQADFTFKSGQTTYFVPYSEFTCSSRGRKLSNCGDLSQQLNELTELGVGSDGVAGPFRLEINSIVATSLATSQDDLISQGIAAFEAADVNESARLFDEALAEGQASSDYFWQRGITLYYVDRFEDGAEQFRNDVAHGGGADTEESIWTFVCEAPTVGFDQAREQMIVIEGEFRPYMQTLYGLFKGDGSVSVQDVEKKTTEEPVADAFYYALYLGLYEEAAGDAEKAETWITKAATSDYATGGDYMGDVAVVHAKVRGWLSNSSMIV